MGQQQGAAYDRSVFDTAAATAAGAALSSAPVRSGGGGDEESSDDEGIGPRLPVDAAAEGAEAEAAAAANVK